MGLIFLSVNAFAEVYSCGPGCYTSSPKRGGGKANLGHKIGSYTSAPAPVIWEATEQAPAVAQENLAKSTVQHASVRRAPVAATARSVPVVAQAPAPVAPRVSTVKSRGRRTILEQELNNERNALAAAQKALAGGRTANQNDANHQARVRQLESAVLDRQQNIQALQRELGRM